MKAETEDTEGVHAGVDADDAAGFHEAIDEVEVAPNGAMIEA